LPNNEKSGAHGTAFYYSVMYVSFLIPNIRRKMPPNNLGLRKTTIFNAVSPLTFQHRKTEQNECCCYNNEDNLCRAKECQQHSCTESDKAHSVTLASDSHSQHPPLLKFGHNAVPIIILCGCCTRVRYFFHSTRFCASS